MSVHDLEHIPVRQFRSPFELTLLGGMVIAVIVVVLAIGLLLTDVGMVNW